MTCCCAFRFPPLHAHRQLSIWQHADRTACVGTSRSNVPGFHVLSMCRTMSRRLDRRCRSPGQVAALLIARRRMQRPGDSASSRSGIVGALNGEFRLYFLVGKPIMAAYMAAHMSRVAVVAVMSVCVAVSADCCGVASERNHPRGRHACLVFSSEGAVHTRHPSSLWICPTPCRAIITSNSSAMVTTPVYAGIGACAHSGVAGSGSCGAGLQVVAAADVRCASSNVRRALSR